jgi:hypothetical protein
MKQKLKPRERKLFYGAGFMLLSFFAVLMIFGDTYEGFTTVSTRPEVKKPQNDGMRVDACVYARQTVKEKLKSPRSADFEGSCNSSTRKISENNYEVSGYVYAQNSFGAELRSYYKCSAIFIGSSWQTSCAID